VNFSPNSTNAAHYAADLALIIGADLRLLYIFQIPMSMSETPMPESVFEDLQGNGRQLLDNLSAELSTRTRGKVHIQTDIEIGTVEGEIEKFCTKNDPLMVVMGATGDGLENALTGSSSVRAVRHLPYPVLVVPEHAHLQAIRYIVVACDEEDIRAGLPVATPVLQLMSGMPDLRIEVVHVITGDESATEFTLAYNHWKNGLWGLQPALRLLRATNVQQGLNEFLTGCGADLLVVFPKKHALLEFHKSQAKRLVMHCGMPVISVHE
jgi:nucleotide-binding universal stress UspA family protein